MPEPTPKLVAHWAVTGRICGDDEDSPYVCGPCTREEALSGFRIHMRLEVGLPTLDGEPDLDCTDPEGKTVFVNSIFRSTCRIEHA